MIWVATQSDISSLTLSFTGYSGHYKELTLLCVAIHKGKLSIEQRYSCFISARSLEFSFGGSLLLTLHRGEGKQEGISVSSWKGILRLQSWGLKKSVALLDESEKWRRNKQRNNGNNENSGQWNCSYCPWACSHNLWCTMLDATTIHGLTGSW